MYLNDANFNILTYVQIDRNDTITMLYKVAQGTVTKSHYGLALARIVPLPPGVMEHATRVAQKLERQVQKRKKTSTAVIKERRRKLILNLKEHLVQTYSGVMEGEVLAVWLKELQKEFVTRMTAIDAEEALVEQGSSSDEDEEMRDESGNSHFDDNGEERPESRSTYTSQHSVITVDSHISSTEWTSTIRAVSENEL